MEKLFLCISVIIGAFSTYLFIEHMNEFKNSEERKCQMAMRSSGEEHQRFKSSTHALRWCSVHRENWKSLVTPATLKKLEQNK